MGSVHYQRARELLAEHLGCPIKEVKAKLAECLVKQVLAVLTGWLEQVKRRIVTKLRRLQAPDVSGAFQINTHALWDLPDQIRAKLSVSPQAIQLAETLWAENAVAWPRFDRLPLRLSGHVEVEPPKRAKTFDGWVRIPAVGPRGKLALPIRCPQSKSRSLSGPITTRKALRVLDGPYRRFVEISQEGDSLEVRVVRELRVFPETYSPKVEAVGLDFGLTWALAEDSGTLRAPWIRRLRRHDRRITRLRASLQRTGLYTSRRLERYQNSKQGFVRTSLGTAVNRLVEQRSPKTIVVERLDFRGGGLSRGLNRIVGSCGRRFFRQKLADVQDRLGISIVEVPAAYTSMTCSYCGFVDARNRRGSIFWCKYCHRKIHSDVNAARNILARRQDDLKVEALREDRPRILDLLVRQWIKRVFGANRSTGPPVRAREALASSSYLRKRLAPGLLAELLRQIDRSNGI